MNVLRIVLSNEDTALYDHLQKALLEEIGDITLKNTQNKEFFTLDVLYTAESSAPLIKAVVSECAFIFLKYAYFKDKIVLNAEAAGLYYYCLMGTLLAVAAKEETQMIQSVMRHSKLINLAGIAHFRLDRLYEDWECLADIFNRLISADKQTRLSDLILYFLTLDESVSNIVTITKDLMRIIVDGRTLPVPELTPSVEANALIFSMYFKPASVTVKDKNMVTEEFVNVIKSLGE